MYMPSAFHQHTSCGSDTTHRATCVVMQEGAAVAAAWQGTHSTGSNAADARMQALHDVLAVHGQLQAFLTSTAGMQFPV